MSEKVLTMTPVPFQADTLWASERDGSVLVALRPICDNLGLNWSGQFLRVKRHAILKGSVCMMQTETPVGAREMVCLPLNLIPGWLFGVEVRRVKPELRERLTQYQHECFEVLWRHFSGGGPGDRRAAASVSVGVHRKIETYMHAHQQRVLAAVKAYGETDPIMVYDATGLSEESVQRALFMLIYLGVVELSGEPGASTKYRYVPPEERPPLPMPAVKAAKH